AFKAERFLKHVEAIGWQNDFEYISVNDPPRNTIVSAVAGERAKLEAAAADRLLQDPRWRNQREERNPRRRSLPQFEDPEFGGFIEYIFGSGSFAPLPSWKG